MELLFFRYDEKAPNCKGDQMDLSLPWACGLEGCVIGTIDDDKEVAARKFVSMINNLVAFKDRVGRALFVCENPEEAQKQHQEALAAAQKAAGNNIIPASSIPAGIKPPGK